MKVKAYIIIIALVAAIGYFSFGNAHIISLDDDEIASIAGGESCRCRDYAACGSSICIKSDDIWLNCSGDTVKFVCVDSTDSNDECTPSGISIPCGVWQECTTSSCSSCTPEGTPCTITSSGSGDDWC